MIAQSDILKIEMQKKVMEEVRKVAEVIEKPIEHPNETSKELSVA
jgi:hypothetical protein